MNISEYRCSNWEKILLPGGLELGTISIHLHRNDIKEYKYPHCMSYLAHNDPLDVTSGRFRKEIDLVSSIVHTESYSFKKL